MDQTTQPTRPTAAREPCTLSQPDRQAMERRNKATSSPFLQLPREIRDMIYLFAMADLPTRLLLSKALPFSPHILYPKTLPALCFANHKLFEEARLAYITRTCFVFADDPESSYTTHYTFAAFILQFANGAVSVRMLAYQQVQQFGDPAGSTRRAFERAEGLVANCTGLRSLILVFPWRRAFACTDNGRRCWYSVLSMGDIKEVFIFDGLFEMRSLRELIVRFQRETRLDRFDRVRMRKMRWGHCWITLTRCL
jgi:hypothetical protein